MGRKLWSMDFWPEWLSDSVCPEESIYLQTGTSGHNICHPSPDLPPKCMLVTVLPLGISCTESCGCWGSLPFALQIQDLTCPLLIFLHPAVPGVLYARGQHLPGHFLSAAWLRLLSASASHLCQDLPSSTGCPQPKVVAGPGFTLAQQPPWVGDLT